ncbi:MAG TPA: hypothetical protein VH496_14670 [Mycobacterium sp.]|jgi:hypothetical protein
MTSATLSAPVDRLCLDVSDADLEAAADELALAYTYQTSNYDPCCY